MTNERNYFCISILADVEIEGARPVKMCRGDMLTIRGPGRVTVIHGTVKLLTPETEAEWGALVAAMYPPDEEHGDELVDRIFQSIDAWLGPPGSSIWDTHAGHANHCAAYSEGQLCCLDKEHLARAILRALVEQAIKDN